MLPTLHRLVCNGVNGTGCTNLEGKEREGRGREERGGKGRGGEERQCWCAGWQCAGGGST